MSFLVSSQEDLTLETEIYNVFKAHKIKLNGNSVTLNSDMSVSCREHSKKMGEYDSLFHVSFTDDIIAKSEIVQRNNNLRQTNKEVAQSVLKVFLNSPNHKELLEENSKLIGIGVYITDGYLVWVTVRFL
jgi:uncharacterized protein YkwD